MQTIGSIQMQTLTHDPCKYCVHKQKRWNWVEYQIGVLSNVLSWVELFDVTRSCEEVENKADKSKVDMPTQHETQRDDVEYEHYWVEGIDRFLGAVEVVIDRGIEEEGVPVREGLHTAGSKIQIPLRVE